MDDYLQWLFAGLSLLVLLGWLGHRVCKRVEAKRRSERAAAEAAARAEALRANAEEAARQQAARKTAAMQAARAEAARLARAEAARAEAERLAAVEAVRAEAARAQAARVAAEEAARAEAARVAAAQAARAQAARLAAEKAARAEAEAARLAAEDAARAQAARAAAEEATLAQAARAAADEAARLEAKRQAAAAAPTPSTPPLAAKTPDQMLVMVADDSKIVRIKTGRLLAQHHYRVSYATDGLDAAQQMQTSIPDVVITDVEMPGMDGFELTRHVRQNPLTARIPIIMITAANDRHREDADRAGVNVLLGKPYADEELIAHIRLATNRNESHAHTGF